MTARVSAEEARALAAAATGGAWEAMEIRDGRLAGVGPEELAVAIHDDPRAYQKPDGTWHSVIICRGMDGPTREGNAALIAAAPALAATVVAQAEEIAGLRSERDAAVADRGQGRHLMTTRVPTERVRALRSVEPGPQGGTLIDTAFLRDLAADLDDERAARSVETRRLDELLAVIHRDGGHYVTDHGVDRACAAAVYVILDGRAAQAAAERDAADARRALGELAGAVRAVGDLIAEHGCSCDCDCAHTTGEHTSACDPCLACRASDVVSPLLRAPGDAALGRCP